MPFAVVTSHRAVRPLGPYTDSAILGAGLLKARPLLSQVIGFWARDTAVSRCSSDPLVALMVASTALGGASIPRLPIADFAIDRTRCDDARGVLDVLGTLDATEQGLLEDGL
jgi:hypothetical protein